MVALPEPCQPMCFSRAIIQSNCEHGVISVQDERPLKILIISAEMVPFVKVGGLADVVGALPKSLQALGHDIRLAMPRYGQVDPTRFHLETIVDAVPLNMSNLQLPVSVRRATVGDAVPLYMVDAPSHFARENI